MNPRALPYSDAPEQLWLGADTPGMVRKVFKIVSAASGAEQMVAGVTVFEPGESSSMHVHEHSEEVNFVLSGTGLFVTDDGEQPFVAGHVMYVPMGAAHQHRNTGTEPLVLGWAYSPQADLPST